MDCRGIVLLDQHRVSAVDGQGDLGVTASRKTGQVPVLGLRRVISSGVRVKRTPSRLRSSG